jgi:hypothetical protein
MTSEEPSPSIPYLLQLNEDDVWALAKSDLRHYFLTLQAHARMSTPKTPLLEHAFVNESSIPTRNPTVGV